MRLITGSREPRQSDFKVVDKLAEDNRHLVIDEERQYARLKNQLIEIQLGAEEGLRLLRDELAVQEHKLDL